MFAREVKGGVEVRVGAVEARAVVQQSIIQRWLLGQQCFALRHPFVEMAQCRRCAGFRLDDDGERPRPLRARLEAH